MAREALKSLEKEKAALEKAVADAKKAEGEEKAALARVQAKRKEKIPGLAQGMAGGDIIEIGDIEIVKSEGRYQKIAANCNRLADNARQWSCVADTQTGLMWEVKTNGGLHDKDKTYRWGGKGVSKIALGKYLGNNKREESRWNGKGDRYKDWNALVDGTNREALCGHSDWRVPTLYELSSLVYCSNCAYDLDNGCRGKNRDRDDFDSPTINTAYFPNTEGRWFWSSSPHASYSPFAWIVYFSNGHGNGASRYNAYRVWLVRGGQ